MPEDKAEKLRYDENGWEKDGQQFVIQMSSKFGIATAGEHAGFKATTDLTIHAAGKTYQEKGECIIQKDPTAEKDADGYIRIQPTYIKWDREGFEGIAKTEASINLLNPAGSVMGDAVTGVDDVTIEGPVGGPGDDVPG